MNFFSLQNHFSPKFCRYRIIFSGRYRIIFTEIFSLQNYFYWDFFATELPKKGRIWPKWTQNMLKICSNCLFSTFFPKKSLQNPFLGKKFAPEPIFGKKIRSRTESKGNRIFLKKIQKNSLQNHFSTIFFATAIETQKFWSLS